MQAGKVQVYWKDFLSLKQPNFTSSTRLNDVGLLQQVPDGVRGLRAIGQPLLDGRGIQVGLLL